jgi:putative aldouronate transport system substrate-binding protein
MEKTFRALTLGCVLLVVAGALYAAGEAEAATGDTAEFVDLRMYLMGNEPADMDSVLAEINEMLEEDLNASVDVTFSTWSDWRNKYNIILTSGEEYDLMYSARWLNYSTYALRGAYTDLTDLIPEYAPTIYENADPVKVRHVTIDGKVFGVPNAQEQYQSPGILYREDLRLKYDLPEIDSWEAVELYLTTIAENEPDLMPMANPEGGDFSPQRVIERQKLATVDYGNSFVVTPEGRWREFELLHFTDEYREAMIRARTWQERGYWSRNAISLQGATQDFIVNRRAAMTISANLGKAKSAIESLPADTDMKLDFVPVSFLTGISRITPGTQDLMTVPRASKNAGRALQLLDLLMWDKDYFRLSMYGIEGKHYRVTDDGYLDISGIDAEQVGFHPEAMNPWGWRNDEYRLPSRSGWAPEHDAMMEKLADYRQPYAYAAFPFDATPVQAELAAIQNVVTQYGVPLMCGLVEDVDDGLKELQDRLIEAGVEEYKAEVERQAREYLESQGL